jgi:hypothetical protein
MNPNTNKLKSVLNQIRKQSTKNDNVGSGTSAFRGIDENGTAFEKYIETLLITEGFDLISLDKNRRGWSELHLTTAQLKVYLSTGQYDMITNHFKMYGKNFVFIQQSDNPPDFILYMDGVVYYMEAKKTTKNSITYGDNLPKPNYIYILRDTKNGVQTFYFGEDIISGKDRDITYKVREEWKIALSEINEKFTRKLPTDLWNLKTRHGFSNTVGGMETMPSLSPNKEMIEERVLNYIETGIKDNIEVGEVHEEGILRFCK